MKSKNQNNMFSYKAILKSVSAISVALFAVMFLSSCEDRIDVDLETGEIQLVVDGWLNNFDGQQRIRLSTSQPYFDNGPIPQVTGAQVSVANLDLNLIYEFEDMGNGNYVYNQPLGERIIKQNHNYQLTVTWEGNIFTALSRANRTTVVDSITWEFREAGPFNSPAGFFAELHGTDSAGAADFYWIRTFRNGQLLQRTGLVNIAFDGAGGPGADGFPFIPPIRFRATDGNSPYEAGDSIRVEIHSMSREAYFFMEQALNQISNGGLFATPPENIVTNLVNQDPNGPRALGWFNVGMVEWMGRKIE
ncbi:MAG: DUF4249 domain-containing protein [Luteibaculaceae bacterium]